VISALSVGIAGDPVSEALHILIVKRAECDLTEEAIRDGSRTRIEKFKLPSEMDEPQGVLYLWRFKAFDQISGKHAHPQNGEIGYALDPDRRLYNR
jgi:hypothetical protein